MWLEFPYSGRQFARLDTINLTTQWISQQFPSNFTDRIISYLPFIFWEKILKKLHSCWDMAIEMAISPSFSLQLHNFPQNYILWHVNNITYKLDQRSGWCGRGYVKSQTFTCISRGRLSLNCKRASAWRGMDRENGRFFGRDCHSPFHGQRVV